MGILQAHRIASRSSTRWARFAAGVQHRWSRRLNMILCCLTVNVCDWDSGNCVADLNLGRAALPFQSSLCQRTVFQSINLAIEAQDTDAVPIGTLAHNVHVSTHTTHTHTHTLTSYMCTPAPRPPNICCRVDPTFSSLPWVDQLCWRWLQFSIAWFIARASDSRAPQAFHVRFTRSFYRSPGHGTLSTCRMPKRANVCSTVQRLRKDVACQARKTPLKLATARRRRVLELGLALPRATRRSLPSHKCNRAGA